MFFQPSPELLTALISIGYVRTLFCPVGISQFTKDEVQGATQALSDLVGRRGV